MAKYETQDLTWCPNCENEKVDKPKFQQDANQLLFALSHSLLQQSSIVAYIGGAHLKKNHKKLSDM